MKKEVIDFGCKRNNGFYRYAEWINECGGWPIVSVTQTTDVETMRLSAPEIRYNFQTSGIGLTDATLAYGAFCSAMNEALTILGEWGLDTERLGPYMALEDAYSDRS